MSNLALIVCKSPVQCHLYRRISNWSKVKQAGRKFMNMRTWYVGCSHARKAATCMLIIRWSGCKTFRSTTNSYKLTSDSEGLPLKIKAVALTACGFHSSNSNKWCLPRSFPFSGLIFYNAFLSSSVIILSVTKSENSDHASY